MDVVEVGGNWVTTYWERFDFLSEFHDVKWLDRFPVQPPTIRGQVYRLCLDCGRKGFIYPDADGKPRLGSWAVLCLMGHSECEICGHTLTKAGVTNHKNKVHPGWREYRERISA